MLLLERHAAGGHAALLLHLQLALQLAAPHRLDEAAVLGLQLLGLFERMRFINVVVEILLCLLKHPLLDKLQLLGNGGFEGFQRNDRLFAVVAADKHALSGLDIARADLDAHGHALHLILRALPAHGVIRIVKLHAKPRLDQTVFQFRGLFQNACLVHGDGQDDDLDGGDLRRQDEAVVVAVGHDDRADHARGGAPGGLERVLQLVVAAGEGHVVSAGELIAEVVAGRALQRLVVLHEALDGVGRFRAGELFLLGLLAGDDGDGEDVLKEIGVALQLLLGYSRSNYISCNKCRTNNDCRINSSKICS